MTVNGHTTADYRRFLASKSQAGEQAGFEPLWLPDFLYPFQRSFVDWSVRMGRAGIFCDCGLGKGQPPDSPVLTPTGWKPIGQLIVGDKVIASGGRASTVIGVFPKPEQDTFRVFFSDGSNFVVDRDHLHICRTNNDRQRGRPWRVLSTDHLLSCGNLRYGEGNKSRNYDIPVVGDVIFESVPLPIDPYILGVLLGDGHLKGNVLISSADDELLDEVRYRLPDGVTLSLKGGYGWKIMTGLTGNRRHPFRGSLEELGLLNTVSNTKFVPESYLFATQESRLALLRGLMDTDGYISPEGTCQFYSVSDRLASGVVHLVRSLGGIPTRSIKQTSCDGKPGQPCHIVTFSLATHNPFLLSRKAVRWNSAPRDNGRWIDRIEFEGRQPTVCISVDSADSSYVTEHFIVTHNTPMQLVWAENVVRHTNRPVLILAPLAVAHQFKREAEKFGVEAHISADGKPRPNITIANYERLHKFDMNDYSGVACDEASIIKHWTGATQKSLTRFLSKLQYRLLSTATPAPNDYLEMGVLSEALGGITHTEMLGIFFRQLSDDEKKKRATADDIISSKRLSWRVIQSMGQWVLRPHAFEPFWKWVASWARACRQPSDLGDFDDSEFILPPLIRRDHEVIPRTAPPGYLFTIPAFGVNQERGERLRTLDERSELVAELVKGHDLSIIWCQLNPEGDRLEEMIPNALQVAGKHDLDYKETVIEWFLGQKCICNDPRFRGRLASWENTDQSRPIGANASCEEIQRSGESTVASTTTNTSGCGGAHKSRQTDATLSGGSNMPRTQNSGGRSDETSRSTGRLTQRSGSRVNCESGESPSSNTTPPSRQGALFADDPTPTDGSIATTRTTATIRAYSEDSSAPPATSGSASSGTIPSGSKRQPCICGHQSGIRRLISKPKIAGLGLNLQHCAHVVCFVTHSYEAHYQCIRRCYRFGQKRPVTLDVIATEGEVNVRRNMDRKERLADQMFGQVIKYMNDSLSVKPVRQVLPMEVPSWLKP